MKIKITEGQFNRIKSRITEGVDNSYSDKIKLNFWYTGLNYKGVMLEEILPIDVTITYTIELEARPWGIKDIDLYGINGPSEIEVTANILEGDDVREITIPLVLNWEAIDKNEETGRGVVTVGEEGEVTLVNDNEGNLIVKKIEVPVYTL